MLVKVFLSSILREYVTEYDPSLGLNFDFDKNLTVMEVIDALKILPGDVKIIVLNGKIVNKNATLRNGDRLGLFPALGGG